MDVLMLSSIAENLARRACVPAMVFVIGAVAFASSAWACEKSRPWIRRFVTLEAAAQFSCPTHLRSTDADLAIGAFKRIVDVMNVKGCNQEIMAAVDEVREDIFLRGRSFCAWATEVRDKGYGSEVPWPTR